MILEHIHGSMGGTTDGWHSFDMLYNHRYALFAVLANSHPHAAWKSRVHHDGTMDDGFFIAGLNLPTGDVTYHVPLVLWDMLAVREQPVAPPWDGHTAGDVVTRLWAYAARFGSKP